MTLQEIQNTDKLMLTPCDVAQVLSCDPQLVRVAAKTNPSLLGFPVCVLGNRVKIPRQAFLKFIEGGNNNE